MRIGLSANFIEPALCHGKLDGIGTYTQELYRQLIMAGEEVVPVVFPSLKNLKPLCQLPRTHVVTTPYPISAGLAALGLPTPGIKQLTKKIDIYHCTDYLVPPIKDVPVVAMIHDAVKVQHPQWNSSRWRALKTIGLKKAVRWADHYIAPSQAVIPELEAHFGIDPQKITVVYNAVADYWFEKVAEIEKQKVLNKYQLKPEFLLFAGTFQPRKNIRRILEAFKNLPREVQNEHPLVLVGQRGWVEEEVIEEIKNLSIKGNVYWLHYVSTDELRCLYQSAKIFLFPSLHEGFGLPILEAFASGLPVLTANLSAMPEVAGESAWLVDPYAVEDIQNGIMTLLNNKSQREELIEKGKARAKIFTWEQCKKDVINVYKKLI